MQMLRIPLTLLFAATLAGAVPAAAQDAVDEYAGAYRDGAELIVFSARNLGPRRMLLMTDGRTGRIRVLAPAGRDTFTAGPTLVQPEPELYRIAFERGPDGVPRTAVVGEAGLVGERRGERIHTPTREVSFAGAGVTLHGLLLSPSGAPNGAAVLLIPGSEDEGRDGFDALPYVLAARGYTVLAYDKRGVGASGGSWRDAGLEELADDAAAALRFLRAQPGVDGSRVALVGFSEGGWVAPMAAARQDGVRAIASISGGAFTKGDSYLHKNRLAFQEQGLAGAALDSAMAVEHAVVDSARIRSAAGRGSGFERRISYDATTEWQAFGGPVLYLLGELDVLEPTERSAARMRENLAAAGNQDVVIHVFPRAHHSLWVGRTGLPSEWRGLAFDRYAPGYWPTLLGWLDSRLSP